MIVTGYMLPLVVIVGCMVAATVMAHNPAPESAVDDYEDTGLPVIEADVNGWLEKHRRMLKFLATLVVCWIIGNVPLIYFLRGSTSAGVEVLLVLIVVGHQLALPIATLVRQPGLWSRLCSFMSGVVSREPRTVSHGTQTDRRSDEETVTNAGDVGALNPAPSSCADGDGQDPRSTNYHSRTGRCVTFDGGEGVHICMKFNDEADQQGNQRSEDVDEQPDTSQLFFTPPVVSDNQSSSGKLSTTIQNCDV